MNPIEHPGSDKPIAAEQQPMPAPDTAKQEQRRAGELLADTRWSTETPNDDEQQAILAAFEVRGTKQPYWNKEDLRTPAMQALLRSEARNDVLRFVTETFPSFQQFRERGIQHDHWARGRGGEEMATQIAADRYLKDMVLAAEYTTDVLVGITDDGLNKPRSERNAAARENLLPLHEKDATGCIDAINALTIAYEDRSLEERIHYLGRRAKEWKDVGVSDSTITQAVDAMERYLDRRGGNTNDLRERIQKWKRGEG